ncbi:alpha/beta hydrolase [Pseudomonas sp. NPDC078700]|uniref:alpha/beta hydrolase n=1 Tax=Pseudomonas sp. NPDC078700 TaxID=3364424 RepID=UPI0037C901CF
MNDFVVSARRIKQGAFIAEPGPSRFLLVADNQLPQPQDGRTGVTWINAWLQQMLEVAIWGVDERTGAARGDILIFVHGYNNSPVDLMARHRQLKNDLYKVGWKGALVSFDWPSDNKTAGYLEDRHDAKQSAMQLVTDLISLLAAKQTPDCAVNTHILAHSMGAYVVREAFDDADDARLENNSWMISQLLFIGADISSGSLSEGNATSDSLYRHSTRLTNYFSLGDSVLKLSNVKRAGVAPRAGRIGLPPLAPNTSADIDCSLYHQALLENESLQAADQPNGFHGNKNHSWFFGNRVFTLDLFETLKGDLDRSILPTRSPAVAQRCYNLIRPAAT